MKRRQNVDLEGQKDIILKLLNESQSYEAIELFLSKLNPNELYVLANIPELYALRVYLNGPGIFKTLFEIRARTPNPVSAVERDILQFMQIKKGVNYWKLWLCAWESVNSDENMIITLENDSVTLQIERGWYENSPYRLRLFLDFDQTKLPINQFKELYPEDDVVWHPVARYYQFQIIALLKQMTRLDEIDIDVEPEQILGDRYYIGEFNVGKNDASQGDPLYFPANLIPHHTLGAYEAQAAFAKYQNKNRYQFYQKVVEDANYQAENLVWAFDCFNRALIAFILLVKYKTAFLQVERDDYGVTSLKTCIACENPAYYQEKTSKAYVCGEPGCLEKYDYKSRETI